jgi:chromosomal replication initiator protein
MNSEMLWSEFLALVREEAGIRVVETWFHALALHCWDVASRRVYIEAPNAFVRDWVATHFQAMLIRIFSRLLHSADIKVFVILAHEQPILQLKQSVDPNMHIIPAIRDSSRTSVVTVRKRARTYSMLQNMYRFDTFIVGAHNALAYAAAHTIIEKPGKMYNPFFVYGKSGSGKTHLLHAMGNAFREKSHESRILYQSANRFVADFIHAVRFNRVSQFEAQYKNIDLLLIDDLQFLAHKEQTQEAFFHLFNSLQHEQRQIVCTCDCLPENMVGCTDRIRSRLASGLVTDISEPSYEVKIEIVRRKAEQQGMPLGEDIIQYIVEESGKTIRDLEGALIRVGAYAAFKKAEVSITLVREALNKNSQQVKPEVDMERIAAVVSRYFNYSLEQIRMKDRTRGIVHARHIIMLLMRRLTSHSLREISVYFRHRDHSTVLHAINKFEQLCSTDEQTQKLMKMLEHQIQHFKTSRSSAL